MIHEKDARFRSRAVICHACRARELASKEWAEKKGNPAGTYFTVEAE